MKWRNSGSVAKRRDELCLVGSAVVDDPVRSERGRCGCVEGAEELADAVALMVAVRRGMTVRVLTSGGCPTE